MGERSGNKKWDQEKVLVQAQAFVAEHGGINTVLLTELGRSDLLHAAKNYFPGRLAGLQAELGVSAMRKPNGYWTVENIERDTRIFVSTYGGFSEDLAVEHGAQALYGVAYSKFPGGIHALKEKIGAKNKRGKAGSWTEERVLKEARDFIVEHGKFTSKVLVESGRYDLLNAVHMVSGGVRSLREQLGLEQLKRPDGYWSDLANVEKEAADYFKANGHIISNRMRLTHPSLVAAISENYPGGFVAIRAKLQSQTDVISATTDEVFGDFFEEERLIDTDGSADLRESSNGGTQR